jgi:hypothetical protein
MSTAEIAAEKVRLLPESQAKSVLDFIAQLSPDATPTARELRRLPRETRQRILAAQAAEAAPHYRQNPDLVVEDVDPPLDYEQGNSR